MLFVCRRHCISICFGSYHKEYNWKLFERWRYANAYFPRVVIKLSVALKGMEFPCQRLDAAWNMPSVNSCYHSSQCQFILSGWTLKQIKYHRTFSRYHFIALYHLSNLAFTKSWLMLVVQWNQIRTFTTLQLRRLKMFLWHKILPNVSGIFGRFHSRWPWLCLNMWNLLIPPIGQASGTVENGNHLDQARRVTMWESVSTVVRSFLLIQLVVIFNDTA